VRYPIVIAVCLSSFALGGVASGWTSVFVLFSYTDTNRGGLGLDPRRIGNALSFMGFISIFIKFSLTWFLKPSLSKAPSSEAQGIDTGAINQLAFEDKPAKIFTFSMRAWPVTFFGFIVLRWVSERFHPSDSTTTTGFHALLSDGNGGLSAPMWIAVSAMLLASRIGCIAFTVIMILSKEASPTPASLGTMNGLLEFAQSVGGSISPVVVDSLFSFTITHHVLDGYLWILLCIVGSFGAVFAAKHVEHGRKKVRVGILSAGV